MLDPLNLRVNQKWYAGPRCLVALHCASLRLRCASVLVVLLLRLSPLWWLRAAVVAGSSSIHGSSDPLNSASFILDGRFTNPEDMPCVHVLCITNAATRAMRAELLNSDLTSQDINHAGGSSCCQWACSIKARQPTYALENPQHTPQLSPPKQPVSSQCLFVLGTSIRISGSRP